MASPGTTGRQDRGRPQRPDLLVDGKVVTLDVPATIEGNRTFVPLRFLSEALGETVTWFPETQMIVVTDQPLTK